MGFDPNNAGGGGWPPSSAPSPQSGANPIANNASPQSAIVPASHLGSIRTAPTTADSDKDQATVFLLSLSGFFGIAGIDRFFIGHSGLGILKLLTAGGCGLWTIADTITIGMGKMRDVYGRPLRIEPTVGTPTRKQSVAFLLSCLGFIGLAGLDRIYLGQTGLGVLKFCTGGMCGLWTLVDFVLIGMGKLRDAQNNSLLPE